ncbi:MAG: DUF523 domain-containing protein [Lachnospiraceae bacterium]|nr:DUF523 domain-containing protein [Lachnospiraceae bacterium]
MNILVSACLLGVHCRYDGNGVLQEEIKQLSKEHHLIPVCPEIFGGLATPRDPAERIGECVITKKGEDVTAQYTKGAEEVLQLCKFYDCHYAILKERSPSCGYGKIYDGAFCGTLIEGNGVTAQLLADYGVEIYVESKISELCSKIDN